MSEEGAGAAAPASAVAGEPAKVRYAKQVIVMRKDLNMRKGKMIAQGAHASMKVLLDRKTAPVIGSGSGEAAAAPASTEMTIALTPAMTDWLGGRFTKVCVSVDSEAALDEVCQRAEAAGVPWAVIVDSGKTEFHGVPTKTCAAIGPAWVDEVDAVTGKLGLL